MNTVRGESLIFVHVVFVVFVFVVQTQNKLLELQILPNKKRKNLKSLSLCFCFRRGVLDKIQSKKRKSLYNAHAPLTLSKTIG